MAERSIRIERDIICCGSSCWCNEIWASANDAVAWPRIFRGYRPQPPAGYDEKGITNSGTGPDYEGIIFSDGTVAVRWMTQYRSHSVWDCWDDFVQVHGHPEYGTSIIFQGGNGTV